MAFSGDRVQINSTGAKNIDEYLEYRRIVGDDDGGTLFTPDQYEKYKQEVVSKRFKNRLFVSWASANSGIECKMVGPETKCFCQHRYKQHQTDFDEIPSTNPIKLPCEVSGCSCRSYSYIPLNGSQPIRCTCKHLTDEHSVIGKKKCKKVNCGCKKFYSAFTCACGDPTYNHKMIIETKEERQSRGKPVGYDVPYKAMGGLTGFSSLADGYMRLDESGIGPPNQQFLQQPSSAFDHPFVKIHSSMKELSLEQPLRTEEDDMAYFEQRYQQRLKREKQAARLRSVDQSKRVKGANSSKKDDFKEE